MEPGYYKKNMMCVHHIGLLYYGSYLGGKKKFIFPAAARKLSQRTHFPNPSQKKSQRILYYKKQKLNTL